MCAKYYELRYMFYKKNSTSLKLAKLVCFLDAVSKFALFSVSGLKDENEKLIKKANLHEKMKHANFVLEYFEYFCQMSSKSILIIFTYIVSKCARF